MSQRSAQAEARPRTSRGATVTPIEPPLLVARAEDLAWSDSAQVVVVGWGAAGACAALQARQEGASVLVIDRFEGGGASALSGGVVYAGGGTPQQKEAGFVDSPQFMHAYLRHEVGQVVSDATLERFCHDSVANQRWLESHGVRFGPVFAFARANIQNHGASGVFCQFGGALSQSQMTLSPKAHRLVSTSPVV